MIGGDRGRDSLQPLAGRHRLSRDMAVDPLHGIGRGERQGAREHLVERDAERIEVAAGIDRAVHPSGLFGRHVGERAGDGLGRRGRLPLARQARGDAETGEPDLSGRAVHQDIGRLDILVDEPRLMDLAQGDRDADGEAQEASHLHGRAEQPLERLAAGILEHQHGPAAFADELQRPHRPGPVQLVLQSVFVGEAIEGGGCRMLRGGQHGQHGGRLPLAPRRHPRQKTRSPSSHKTWRLRSPSAPNREDGLNYRTPHRSRRSRA